MLIKTTLFFFFFINTLFAQENYIDFFLKEYNPVEGDIIFQDLDSSPLCSAIEEVTPGIFNQNFSHVGLIIRIENKFKIIESFSNGVKIIDIRDFLIRSITDSGVPKITIARIHKEFQKKHPNLISKAIKKSKDFLDTPYDEKFLLNNNSFYCSEFIYEIFSQDFDFFNLNKMTFKNKDGIYLKIWVDYFKQLKMKIPEQKKGINPGIMTLNKNLKFIYNYKTPFKFI